MPLNKGDDPDRLAPVEREANVLDSLTYPHVAHTHRLAEAAGGRALLLGYDTMSVVGPGRGTSRVTPWAHIH